MKTKLPLLLLFCLLLVSQTVYAGTYNLYNDAQLEIVKDFITPGSLEFYITLPNENIVSASMKITGEPHVTTTNEASDILLVTDVSGSMNINDRLTDAKEAAIKFLDKVNIENTQIGLTKYSSCPRDGDVEKLSIDKNYLKERIELYEPRGNTNIGGGIRYALKELQSQRTQPNANKYIIILTDGAANRYYDENDECLSNSKFGREYAVNMSKEAAELGVKIYGIGFGKDEEVDYSLIKEMAQITGGKAYFAPTGEDLQQIYDEISFLLTVKKYPQPVIGVEHSVQIDNVWNSNNDLNKEAIWDGSSCGLPSASCRDLKSILQTSVNNCDNDECKTSFLLKTATPGKITLSDLNIQTSPKGIITCASSAPSYLLRDGETLDVPVNEIFVLDGDTGSPSDIIVDSLSGVKLTENFPEFITAETNGLDGTTTAFIKLVTDNGLESDTFCPVTFSTDEDKFGSIECQEDTPSHILYNEEQLKIPLTKIFKFPVDDQDSGVVTTLIKDEINGVDIISDLPENILVIMLESLDGTKTSKIRVKTSKNVVSKSCPIIFTRLNSNCQKDICGELIEGEDIEGLIDAGCIDKSIDVLNEDTGLLLHNVFRELRYADYKVKHFISLPRKSPLIGQFSIFPENGDRSTRFIVAGIDVPHGEKGVGVLKINFNNDDEDLRLCPELNRLNYNAGGPQTDIKSDFLATGSRSVIGYYDDASEFKPKGPYIFTAKVWLRR